MKCLTVQQLYAWAIVEGHKPVENRTWRASYRGPLAIHAGVGRGWERSSREICAQLGITPPEVFARGAIVGVVELVEVIDYEAPGLFDRINVRDCPWAFGPFCWVLSNPKKLDRPIPLRGQLGLFDLPGEIAEQLNRALAG